MAIRRLSIDDWSMMMGRDTGERKGAKVLVQNGKGGGVRKWKWKDDKNSTKCDGTPEMPVLRW
jgi:hypothetical protein